MNVINAYPYNIGTDFSLTKENITALIRIFEKPPLDFSDSVLGGRASVVRTHIAPMGNLVIKYYKRGGLIRRISEDVFLRSGMPRSRREYEILAKVRDLGVSAPEPLAWAIRGSMFYRAYLITREIPDTRSLADLCREKPENCHEALKRTAEQIRCLILNRIHHVDLHPGNVLVGEDLSVTLIDFDKAGVRTVDERKLKSFYTARWERAVAKHTLPETLNGLADLI